jgi:ribosomal-protein-alanine N-acetyltransferase
MHFTLHDGFYLSPIQEGDQAAYLEHFQDKKTVDLLLRIPFPYLEADAEKWVRFCVDIDLKQNTPYHFALRRADGFLIGGLGFQLNHGPARHRAEIGYWVAHDYRGRGLATSMVRAIIPYAFRELALLRLEATSSSQNFASHRVLEKAGFTREGFLAAYYLKEGIVVDVHLFSLLATMTTSPF